MTVRLNKVARAVAVTVTVGAALSLAGCGNETAAGPANASKDQSVKVDPEPALSKSEIMSAAYESSLKAGSAHMTMTMNGQQATSMQGDVSYVGGRATMKATMSMAQLGSRKMELRYVDSIMYLQIPGITPAGKFVAINPKDPSSPLAKSFAGLSDQMDPMASLKKMQSAVVSADRVGQETVQGVKADHYKVVVDAAKALGGLGAPAQAQMPKTITYDMWLDAENLVRRMVFDVAGTSAGIEMSSWGKPVQVTRPAPGDVVKAPSA